MKKLRVFLATAALSSAFMVVGAPPASAKCVSDPGIPNPCVIICEIGTGNKYTEDLFRFCHVW